MRLPEGGGCGVGGALVGLPSCRGAAWGPGGPACREGRSWKCVLEGGRLVGGRVRGRAQGPGAQIKQEPETNLPARCAVSEGLHLLARTGGLPFGGFAEAQEAPGTAGGLALGTPGPRRLTPSRHFLNQRAPGGGAGGEGQGRGHLPGAPGQRGQRAPPSALLAEPGAGGQDRRTQGSGWRSHSGAPGAAGGPPAGVALPPRPPRSARPALLHGFWLRGLVCPFALRFQTPAWKARPVSVRSGLRPAAPRTQLSCNRSALYLHCWLKPSVALHT